MNSYTILAIKMCVSLFTGITIYMIYRHMMNKIENMEHHHNPNRKKRGLLHFDETIRRLKSYGALDKFPKLANPAYYLLVHAVISIAFGIGGFMVTPVASIPFAVVGMLLPEYVFRRQAKSEERELMDDALTLCNMLMSQIRGGVYIGSAISACRTLVGNKRLKKALDEFYISTATAEKTLYEAIDELESKFIQKDILTICMIIRQGEETGKSIDVLNDLNKQIGDMQEEIYLSDKEKLNRRMTLAILLLFADVIGYVVYLFISTMFTQM